MDSSQFLRSDVADQKTSGNLRFDDNVKLQLGTSNDFQIYHDATDDVIHSSATSLRTRSNIFRANNEANNSVFFRAFNGAQFEAYWGGSKKFETTSTGVSVAGTIFASGAAGFGATNNTSYDSAAQNLLVADESSSSGITIRSGGSTPFGCIHFADGTLSLIHI